MKSIHEIIFENSNNMERLNDQSVALIVTSSPYPMIEMWDLQFSQSNPEIREALDEGRGKQAFELMHAELDKTWTETYRVLKDGGMACINIGDATRKIGNNFRLFSNHSRILSHCLGLGFSTLPSILWRKQTNAPNKFLGSGMLPSNAYVTLEHEYILILRKGRIRKFKENEKQRRYESAYFWEERNAWFSDIWLDLKGTGQNLNNSNVRLRSAAYPFELAYRLINMYSIQGDLVLDPFLGMGTTITAAMASNRNSFGYEIEKGFKPLIEESLLAVKPFANNYLRYRLNKHQKFINKMVDKNKPVKYQADKYDFKVVTSQETKIHLPFLKTINKLTDWKYEVIYE
ncbi:MAG: site-specific DNA-methyltransferase [Candidatus Helarchaeota archaeon]|nr:site-specific DNA-methyltransferase [Candidatus Helarchaeota archaeon]